MSTAGTAAATAAAEGGHLRGIDAVRFLCAFWVAISHVGLDVALVSTLSIGETSFWGRVLHGITNNLFAGPPAVIVFFVVSGFCIHLPQAGGRSLELGPYYARRYLRIAPPFFGAMALSWLVSGNPLLVKGISWSLVCEAVYYFMYPAILILVRGGLGWTGIVVTSFAVALLMRMQLGPNWGNYLDYHGSLTWLMGLPCWLMGCALAEGYNLRQPVPSQRKLWAVRAAIWFAASACSVLRFHTPIEYKLSLNVFALLGAFWLLVEVRHATANGAMRWLEGAGAWSYSIYLVHVPAAFLAHRLLPHASGPLTLVWQLLTLALILLMSWGFYRLVEYPSHWIARRTGQKVPRLVLIH